jgi:hypothetical protein
VPGVPNHLEDVVPTLSGAYSCHFLLLVFGTCILNLLVMFVSSLLESIKLQMPLMEMKMIYYCGPLNNPSLMVIPYVTGSFIAPFQEEAVPVPNSS